jgi:hypothetical protein
MSYVINSRGELISATISVSRTFINSDGGIEARELIIDDLHASKPDEMKLIERWETVYFCREQPMASDTEHSFLKDKGVWFAVSVAIVLWFCIYFFSTH